jgi:hypothetical protein
MKQTVFSALAVCAASSLAFANESEDWLTLDKEIESLSASLSQGGSGVQVSAFVKSTYNESNHQIIAGVGNDATANEWGGFALNAARINFDGSVGDFGVHIGLEVGPHFGGFTTIGGVNQINAALVGGLAGAVTTGGGTLGGAGLLPGNEAYATFSVTDQIAAQAGVFRTPFHGGSLRDEDQLLFIDRTFVGDFWANVVGRDTGVQVSGAFDQVAFWLALMNGRDNQGDEQAISARVAFNALGSGTGSVEGAYGADDGASLTVAGGYYHDDDNTTSGGIATSPNAGTLKHEAFTADANFTVGAFSAAVTYTDMSDGFGQIAEILLDPVTPLSPVANSKVTERMRAWDVTFSYMFVEDSWEAAARFEDLDDHDGTKIFSLVVNKYVEGHAGKYQLQYSTADSEANKPTDVHVLTLGVTVSV